jgi:hypothetical protein
VLGAFLTISTSSAFVEGRPWGPPGVRHADIPEASEAGR